MAKSLISPTRQCIINQSNDQITVKLNVNNGMQAGAEFILKDTNNTIIKKWKIKTDNNGNAQFIIDPTIEPALTPTNINNYILRWDILVCSLLAQVDNCKVEIDIVQGNSQCIISPEATWNIPSVPPCNANKAISVLRELIFRTLI